MIGKPPQKIFEIGSGKGELIEYLAGCGYECRATEITRERGAKHTASQANPSWQITDGIHLDRFAPKDTYDVAISMQVIEHMHPDDMLEHFQGVAAILARGGRYIFTTPHQYFSPSDVSRVFKCDKPLGMHLKEYLYREVSGLLKAAGFQKVAAVWRMPPSISRRLGFEPTPNVSRAYLAYLFVIERMLSLIPKQPARRKLASALRVAFFPTDLFMVATKKQERVDGKTSRQTLDRLGQFRE